MFLLNKKIVGIDISDNSIEIVEMEKQGKELRITSLGSAMFEEGIVRRGRIKKYSQASTVI